DPDRMVMMAQPDDFDPMAQLHAAAFARGWSTHDFAAMSNDPAITMLVARRVGTKPGTLDAFNVVRQAADEAEILSIVVDPAQRGGGLGLRLMRDAIARFQTDRLSQVFLEVAEDNAPAVALYKRLGFEVVGRREGYYPPLSQPASDEEPQLLPAGVEHPRAKGASGAASGTASGLADNLAAQTERRTALVMRLGLV
ncbi:MAG: GNAT family N-acetyltransferase, partial [Pseudomonadota bacterium]